MGRLSRFIAPTVVGSWAAVQNAFRDVQVALDRVSRSPYVQGLATQDLALTCPGFFRVSPPNGGVRATLPAASEVNAGQHVTLYLEGALGPLTVFAPAGQTINGSDRTVVTADGIVELHSNGVNGWRSVTQLAVPSVAAATPQPVVFFGADGAEGAEGAQGFPGAPGATGAMGPAGPSGGDDRAEEPGEYFPRGFANVLQAWPRSGGSNVWIDAGQYLNFGLEGPTTANAQIRSGDAVLRIRCTNQISVIGDTNLVLAANGVAGLVAIQATDTNGTVSLATAGALRVVIAGTGEWTTPAGALGNVWTHQGPGAPPIWAAGGGGATGPTGPMGPSGSDGADGSDGIQGPAGTPGAAGATGATGATGPSGSAGAIGLAPLLFSDDDRFEEPVGFIVRPGWANALASNPRSGGSNPFIDIGQFIGFGNVAGAPTTGDIRSFNAAFAITTAGGTVEMRDNSSLNKVQVAGSAILLDGSGATAFVDIRSDVNVGTRIAGAAGTAAGFLRMVQASASTPTVAATEGMYWVRNDAVPVFTDLANNDRPLVTCVQRKTAATSVSAATTVVDATGIFSVPANTMGVGSRFRIEFTMDFIRGATATVMTTTFQVVIGGTGLSVVPNVATVAATYQVRVMGEFTVLTTGVGGTAMGTIVAIGSAITTPPTSIISASNVALAVNTTIANNLQGVGAMGAVVAATTLRAMGGSIEWLA